MDDKTRTVGDSKREATGNDTDCRPAGSGLDAMGQMRIADRITIQARGGKLTLTQSNTGRQVEVAEEVLAGIFESEFFTDKVD
jgi:hypothetical protein